MRQQVLLTSAEREVLERAARDVLGVAMGDLLREAGLREARRAIRRAEREGAAGPAGGKVGRGDG